ncbi:MAG: hypothetical protein U9N06_00595 [candidate division WOR-3 bacterium]|nr:hypothetical protein [candidate division WOR-3 bacterium]
MKRKEIISELIRIAERLEIKIIEDRLLKKGGYCRVFMNKYLIMDKKILEKDKMDLLIEALKRNNLDEIYITPRIRELCNEEE